MKSILKQTTVLATLVATLSAPSATAASATAAAPKETTSLGASITRARQLLVGIKNGTIDRESLPARRAPALVPAGEAPTKLAGSLVGTWFIQVPNEDGSVAFYAYQTFGQDGTYVETSSLLATLTEGPAHGTWRKGDDGKLYLTFELFAFDAGAAVGRIRVRCELSVDGDTFKAQSAVDILDLDGTVVAPEVGTGPFFASRVMALPL